jgi:rhodanese-related sulfurtransferase
MAEDTTPEVSVREAQQRLQEGALLLDVREADEFDELRIPDAQLLPLSELATRYEDELPKDRPIIAQCRSGKRSAKATEFLREQGFDVVNMEGGILAWRDEGLPVEEG